MAIPKQEILQKVVDICRADESAMTDDCTLVKAKVGRVPRHQVQKERAHLRKPSGQKLGTQPSNEKIVGFVGTVISDGSALLGIRNAQFAKGGENPKSHTVTIKEVQTLKSFWPAQKVEVGIETSQGCQLGTYQAIPDSGCEMSVVDTDFMRNFEIGLESFQDSSIPGIYRATGDRFSVLGQIRIRIVFGDAAVSDNVAVVKEKVGMLIAWKKCVELRVFPQNYSSQISANLWIRESKRPSWMVPNHPTPHEIQEVKEKMLLEFADVLVDDQSPLKAIMREPLKIELVAGAVPFQVFKPR
eukprot:TCALIF_06745-PA protein Name:"Protein of unknown function" AED:0.05 eAED:0.22 QI:35/0/0/1/0/0/3/0/299